MNPKHDKLDIFSDPMLYNPHTVIPLIGRTTLETLNIIDKIGNKDHKNHLAEEFQFLKDSFKAVNNKEVIIADLNILLTQPIYSDQNSLYCLLIILFEGKKELCVKKLNLDSESREITSVTEYVEDKTKMH